MNPKPFAAIALLGLLSAAAAAGISSHAAPLPARTNATSGIKKAALKLYPNPSTTGTVRVVSGTPGKLNFYIFDLEGTMLHQAVLTEGAEHKVANLKKGVYTYDAFYNDEGIEHGKLVVK